MRSTRILATAIAALLSYNISTAQAQQSGEAAETRSLTEICAASMKSGDGEKTIEGNRAFVVCNDYISVYYGPSADLIGGMIEAVDVQKDKIRDSMRHAVYWDRLMQGSLIMLAFLTTFSTALARIYRDKPIFGKKFELGLAPIVLSALVTAIASFNAYYKFGESRDRHKVAADELAILQSEINYTLVRSVAEKKHIEFIPANVDTWKKELDRIMSRYVDKEKTKVPESPTVGGGQ